MRIMYNPDLLFTNVNQNDKIKYLKRIKDLAVDLENVTGEVPRSIIDKYRLKKMKGTKSIFKFYLDNTTGARCIFKYEENDPQIFESENGILLLRAVDHDEQGIIGRQLDNISIDLESFLAFDDINNDSDKLFTDDKLEKIREMERNIKEEFIAVYSLKEFITNMDLANKMQVIDDRAIYRLSDNQLRSLDLIGPVFLKGSAGSGKTLVEISKALKNAHMESNQAYFTFTPLLKDTALNLFDKYKDMSGIKGNVDFHVMKDYMLKELGLSDFNYFSFERFKQWYKNKNFRKHYQWMKDLDDVLLWTEIRGLIKGYIGNDNYRIMTSGKFSNFINDKEIETLVKSNIIKNEVNSKSRFNIINSKELKNRYNHTDLDKHLTNNDITKPVLDKYSYVELLTERYSPFNKGERIKILEFVNNHYQKYLEDNNLYDDNDLARMLIEKIRKKEIELYDYILIDELQDLTEMQIIALSSLTKHKSNIMLAGDISQVINPTFFSKGRTGLIYRNIFDKELNESVVLNENYRNSENIVKVIRKILDIRRDKLGVYSDDILEVSVELVKKEGLPIFIDLDKNEMLDSISKWIDVPNVAVIVPSEETKKMILKKYNDGKESNIYSVHEIKGQEFSKIITYNIVSEHKDMWDTIMQGKVDKRSDLINQYRYYFNLLYVAITRGRNNLFMYEEIKDLKIIEEIIDLFEMINIDNLEVLDVSAYDTDNRRKTQAELYFNQRDYIRARNMYLRLNNKRMSQISNAKNNLEIGEIEAGLVELLAYKDFMQDAISYIDKSKYLLLYIIYNYEFNRITINEIEQLVSNKSLIDMCKKYRDFNNYEILLERTVRLMHIVRTNKINRLINGG